MTCLWLSFKIPSCAVPARQLFVETFALHFAFLSQIADFENRNIITSVRTALSQPGEEGDQQQRTLCWHRAHRHTVTCAAPSKTADGTLTPEARASQIHPLCISRE